MKMGKRIKALREEKGLTQKDLATISGVCQQMISKLETGCAQHTSDVVQLAAALGVSAMWLQGLSDDQAGSDSRTSNNAADGQQLHQRAVQICIEYISSESAPLFGGSAFRKQAELFSRCYEVCTRAENLSRSKKELFLLLRKQIK